MGGSVVEEEGEEEENKPSDMEFEISKINHSVYTNINLNSKPCNLKWIAVIIVKSTDTVHLKI